MELQPLLRQHFGYEAFRPGQEELIRALLDGRDCIGIFPTGYGKSLLFQLPGYALEGAVLIVSPLLSLMHDHVDTLKMNGEKRAVAFTSMMSRDEKAEAVRQLGDMKFIYASPEMLANERFLDRLASLSIAYVAIDEAHCISQWGYDFRPDYLLLGRALAELGRPPVIAVTATASAEAAQDIERVLGMRDPFLAIRPLDRPSIAYSVTKARSEIEQLVFALDRALRFEGPGILYAPSRKKAEQMAALFERNGLAASYYHAGMETLDRMLVQQQYLSGTIEWVCATSAFGMGIHKENIRQVIHLSLPLSLAAYLQETGRASRDGNQSVATLVYTETDREIALSMAGSELPDPASIRHFLSGKSEEGLSETARRLLLFWEERMDRTALAEWFSQLRKEKRSEAQRAARTLEESGCIRQRLLTSFGQRLAAAPTLCCSNCGLDASAALSPRQVEQSGEKRDIMDWQARLAALLPPPSAAAPGNRLRTDKERMQ